MKTQRDEGERSSGIDRWLLVIVGAIALLVIITLAIVLTRPSPEYASEDTPEAIVHNYLLALQQDDLARAHGYLSPDLAGYPSLAAFEREVGSWRWDEPSNRSFAIDDSRSFSDDLVRVTVRSTRYENNGPFDSYVRTLAFDLDLREYDQGWRLVSGEQYWDACWEGDCPRSDFIPVPERGELPGGG